MVRDLRASQILQDLENIYSLALKEGCLTVALKAKELLGRAHGLFSSSTKKKFSLKDLSDEEIDELIEDLEAQEARDEG